jgi:DNA-binding response OmpR family regulator
VVAGDRPDSVELLIRVIDAAGHRVHVADDRATVMRLLSEGPVQCILLDVASGGAGHALGVLDAVRAEDRDDEPAVVWFGADRAAATVAWEHGADDVLLRPQGESDLLRSIDAAVLRTPIERLNYRDEAAARFLGH